MLLLDAERADRLEPVANLVAQEAGTRGFLVLGSTDRKGVWTTMECLDAVLHGFRGEAVEILMSNPGITPEDNAAIMFTSGTSLIHQLRISDNEGNKEQLAYPREC